MILSPSLCHRREEVSQNKSRSVLGKITRFSEIMGNVPKLTDVWEKMGENGEKWGKLGKFGEIWKKLGNAIWEIFQSRRRAVTVLRHVIIATE
jgi:hypothetical protein